MYINFGFINENVKIVEKRLSPYELSLFLKSYPEDGYSSILERVWSHYGLIEDWYNEDEGNWYPGFSMPPTWWLLKRIVAEYGQDPIWIKVPEHLLELVEAAKQSPKRRWRTSGKWRKRNKKYHQPWWMRW